MSKIPFTLEAWLKDKSQKVETRDGRIVHNIWPVKEPLIFNGKRAEVCALIDGEEDALVFFEGGRYLPTTKDTDSPFDIFIITPEEELTEFENAFGRAMMEVPDPEEKEEWYPFLKERASELLALAREQFIKDGYVIEKKAFRDAVENISDKHRAEMSVEYSFHCKIEDGTRHAVMNWKAFQKVAQKFIDIGRAEALKDLPRWKISLPEPGKRYVLLFNGGSIVESRDYRRGNFYYEDGEQYKNIEYNPKCVRWMYAEELYQLPGGFKED